MPEVGVVDNSGFPPLGVLENDVSDIELFASMYMRRRFKDEDGEWFPCARMHRDFLYLWTHPEDYPKTIFVAPRAYYKSSFAELAIVYDIVHGGPERFKEHLILGASQPLAEQRLRRIKWELTENALLLRDYTKGRSLEGKKWTDDEIEVANGVTVYARGRGTSMRGVHPDSILIDDIEKEGETGKLSPTEVENTIQWLRGSVIPMIVSKRGRIFLQGNFLGYDSLLHKAYRGKEWGGQWFRTKYEARNGDGKSAWPERFSDEFLAEKEATMGILKFAAEMMNEPMASENPLVLREWIRYFEEPQVPPMLYKIAAFDPAVSLKQSADYSAWCLIGADCSPMNNQEMYYVLDSARGHWDLDERIRRIFAINDRYHPDEIRIENNAFQDDMVVMLEKESERRGIQLPVDRVRRGKGGMPKDKFTALDVVTPLIKLGNVRFRKTQVDLIDELLAFPNAANDDQVDAFTTAMDGMKHKWVEKVQHFANRHYGAAVVSEPAITELGY